VLGTTLVPGKAIADVPVWKLTVASEPTNFAPGSVASGPTSLPAYVVVATNIGTAAASGPVTFTDTLPPGLLPGTASVRDATHLFGSTSGCDVSGQTVTCTVPLSVQPGGWAQLYVPVEVSANTVGSVVNEASVAGGGAGEASASTMTEISSSDAQFGLVSGSAGLSLALSGTDGAPHTQAGSPPYQVTVDSGWPTVLHDDALFSAGHLRRIRLDLPAGLVLNPTATPVRCREAQLLMDRCPSGSQVGLGSFQTMLTSISTVTEPLYNMVPPPGSFAELGMGILGVTTLHLLATVNPATGYGISLSASEVLARELNPTIGVQPQLWGNPADPGHDPLRGECFFAGGNCPAPQSTDPFLWLPTGCTDSLTVRATVASWEAPESALGYSAQAVDPLGNPLAIEGCNGLDFSPSIEVRPTTSLADSPSGLEFDLRLPEADGEPAGAALRDGRIVLPEQMTLDPSGAAGLDSCTEAQFDLRAPDPAACPAAAKVGSVEARTPLFDHPLSGALYLATPHRNPSGALLGLYMTIEDPASGVVVKLAGRAEADTRSGRLTAVFEDAPELPFEDLSVRVFGGPRGPLRTPPLCSTYPVGSLLVPWSAPEGASAGPGSRFTVSRAPGGGPCPAAIAEQPHSPRFVAGTVDPRAGAYSPLFVSFSRADGSQPLAGVAVDLPPGLLARLAGVPSCPEAAIASSEARGRANGGVLEQARPACPDAAVVGRVDVAAGAGISPLSLSGRVYLGPPYKGAPFSLVAIVPAVAGPFDLGTVTERIAVHVDPRTLRVRAISDSLPQILAGVPLDLRSLSVTLGRDGFSRNPTSCEPVVLEASATSPGADANLATPFQVGGCRGLPLAPRASVRIAGPSARGARPRLRAALAFPAGSAGLAGLSLTLPRSLTLAPRRRGPLGHVELTTPLLAQPLHGSLYLRPAARGLGRLALRLGDRPEVRLSGHLEHVGGRLRASFDGLPDAPLAKLVLRLGGGPRGALLNRTGLCRRRDGAALGLTGQNASVVHARPSTSYPCETTASGRRGG
jgi:hypothetical protein